MPRGNKNKKDQAEMQELKAVVAQVEKAEAQKKRVEAAETAKETKATEEVKANVDPEILKLAQMQAIEEAQGSQIVLTAEHSKLVADSAAELHSRIMARANQSPSPLTALQLEMATLIADRETLALRDKLWQEKYGRVTQVKSRLEKLCKDLDAHTKAMAARHEADLAEVARNLNEKHVEQLKHSQEVIERVITQMNATVAENERVAAENQEIRTQYNKLSDFVKARDEQLQNLDKLTKARDAAVEAKLNNQSSVLDEQAKLLKETMQRLTASTKREAALQKQVDVYSKQISEAQSVLKTSAEVVGQLKKDRTDLESKLVAAQKLAISSQEESTKYMRELALATTSLIEMKEKNQKLSALCTKLLEKSKNDTTPTAATTSATTTDIAAASSTSEATPVEVEASNPEVVAPATNE